MPEYIEREKAMALAKDIIVPTKYGNDYRHRCIDPQEIAELPAADVRPVVLCKDCKYSDPWYSDKSRCFLWCENGIDVFNDGFCNYGEKMSKDGD